MRKSALVTTPFTVLAERLNGNVMVLPNGTDPDLARRADGLKIRERYKTPIVGFLGAFEYFVDFELVLEAAERLKEITFLLVGTGRCCFHRSGALGTA
jgi:glycosyltransferase involved in cell wall biosynthesis